MSEKIITTGDNNPESERVPSAFVIDKRNGGPNGTKYELDFCRESVRFAESRGFKLDEITDYPQTAIPNLFYYAFRMHHKKVSRDFTDRFLEESGGLSEKMIVRLMSLYAQARSSNVIRDDEDSEKNSVMGEEL